MRDVAFRLQALLDTTYITPANVVRFEDALQFCEEKAKSDAVRRILRLREEIKEG